MTADDDVANEKSVDVKMLLLCVDDDAVVNIELEQRPFLRDASLPQALRGSDLSFQRQALPRPLLPHCRARRQFRPDNESK